MNKLIGFIRNIYVVVLFILFEVLAVSYYARSTTYTEARLLARSNVVAGSVRGMFAGVRHYFRLGRENRALVERVATLEEELSRYREAATMERLGGHMEAIEESKYHYITAAVVSNSINRRQNFITLNRGRADGVMEDMAVLSPEGAMAGYVVDCTDRYAVAVSVLNTSFRASGRLAGSDYIGSIYWDGRSPEFVIMDELSKYAEPEVGQEVLTTGFSQYFPEDVLIGRVESVSLNETRTAYRVRVRLAAEISGLNLVALVYNRDMWEIRSLQQSEQVELQTRED